MASSGSQRSLDVKSSHCEIMKNYDVLAINVFFSDSLVNSVLIVSVSLGISYKWQHTSFDYCLTDGVDLDKSRFCLQLDTLMECSSIG